jgi:predicted transcriptional regulator
MTTRFSENLGFVLKQFQNAPPVDVVGYAEELGLAVWETPGDDNFSGMIKRDAAHGGSAGYSILVNDRHSETRKRFTIAHEIGHFRLHRSQIGDGLTDDALYRSGLSTMAEVQANRMAADILMPFSLIEREMKKGVRSVDELARIFNVSKQAMSIRLQLVSD